MDGEHRTRVDDLEATWRLDHQRIRIVNVYNTSENLPVVNFQRSGCPDLAEARERLPKLSRLWDAVRHDLWAEWALVPPSRASRVHGYDGR
ncbi:hypothetical protein [Nocardia pseudobrasiliensis]|uniref:Uncharacterized protein n=1 Tax=Nocardia pseudobrasiliensis TaxID=45979 RepID=A0A370I7X0_9NOCA|nr:hypothetical protein [Nocardia pseudobrasiliensis]RDI66827.1 hypothetical protein DFR76_104580 [Nocardia pseudobrasiliensis]